MKKKILCSALAMLLMFSTTACQKEENYYKLPHFQPTAENEGYDTDLLYKNLSQFWGGDSGVIYVSEEENPEYGGYFYQYMSGCAGVYNGDLSSGAVPSDKNGNTATKPEDVDHYGFVTCTRSKDLNDWELVGAVDNGFCLKVMPDEWVFSSVWSPETIYDAKTNKYYMYFSGKSKINPGDDPELHYSNADSGAFSRFYLSVAVSDTPVGPFTLASSLEYYGENGAKNENGEVVDLNGDVITGRNPVIDPGYYFKNNPNSIYREQLKDVEYPIWSAIDPSPFFDENGDLYLYCSNHGSNILRILCERRKETLENLAFELEVSRNTIQRDIEVLSLTYPIYTSQGIGGGVCIVDNFRLGMKYLTDTQCELLEMLLETQEGEAKEILHIKICLKILL